MNKLIQATVPFLHCWKIVPKTLAKFTEKNLCWSSFSVWTLACNCTRKKGIICRLLPIFSKQLFYWTSVKIWFWKQNHQNIIFIVNFKLHLDMKLKISWFKLTMHFSAEYFFKTFFLNSLFKGSEYLAELETLEKNLYWCIYTLKHPERSEKLRRLKTILIYEKIFLEI